VAVPVELGDAGEALQVARTIDPSPLAAGLLERRAMFHIEVARAYGQRHDDAAAVATLLEAERVAPEEIHYHVVVRELLPGSNGTAAPPGQASRRRQQRGVLVPIDNCDRVESLSALPRRSAGVMP
jgi:hypothetical protein